jgi:hypothetical protein
MKTYFTGITVNWQTGRLTLFCVTDKEQVPVSCKDLQSVKARSKKQARIQYLFAQL